MLSGQGGNMALCVGSDGAVLIDDELAVLTEQLQTAIAGITTDPLRFVINTHWHFDHTGGNEGLANGGAVLVAHENVRERLRKGQAVPAFNQVFPPAPAAALPVITFDRSLTVYVNGEGIRALHYAKGHTDGDAIVYFPKSNVVHMGDDFVTYGLPFVDVANGGSVLGLVDNVEKAMAALPHDVKIIPGHGPTSTKAEVKKFTDMLRDCIALVQAGMKRGRTLAQLRQDNVLAKYDPEGKGFVKAPDFAELIYNELAGTPTKTSQADRTHH
jgi:glyoxylase-like metal-dependent hydrolase (beta-lactamase superfamily II)